MIHMGSETIPPCKENIIHITLDKPLQLPGCQFKLLRENSLVSSRAKEIHTRYQVPKSDRPVYYFNKKKISYIPSISGIVPSSYKKYTLTKASKNKKKKPKMKTKIVVRNVKGRPVTKKIKVKAKKPLVKNILKRKKNKGFGPGYKNGKKSKSDGTCKV